MSPPALQTGRNTFEIQSGGRRSRTLSRPYGVTLLLLLPLIFAYLTALAIPDSELFTDAMNRFGPLMFIAVLGVCAFRILRRNPDTIWTPVFWLPAQSAVFFGFGPLVEKFGNPATKMMLSVGPMAITDNELLLANLLSTAGVWFLLFGVFIHFHGFRRLWSRTLSRITTFRPPVLSTVTVAWLFIIVGGALKYLLALPAQWGMIDLVFPGMLSNVLPLLDVGFGLMAFAIARGRRSLLVVFWVLWPLHVFLSILTFAKTQMFTAALFPILGYFMARHDLKRLILLLAALMAFFPISQVLVQLGRAQVYAETGTISNAGYIRRLEITLDALENMKVVQSETSQVQDWWTRLDYAGPQVAAIRFRENGIENTSMKNLPYYFVPRLIWPGKPVLVPSGLRFYHLVSGNNGVSFLGLSIYGDLFWTAGSIGVALGSFVIGWLFAFFSIRSLNIIRTRDFIYFPLVLMPLQASILGVTSFVSGGIIGWMPIYFGYVILIRIGVRFLRPQTRLQAA